MELSWLRVLLCVAQAALLHALNRGRGRPPTHHPYELRNQVFEKWQLHLELPGLLPRDHRELELEYEYGDAFVNWNTLHYEEVGELPTKVTWSPRADDRGLTFTLVVFSPDFPTSHGPALIVLYAASSPAAAAGLDSSADVIVPYASAWRPPGGQEMWRICWGLFAHSADATTDWLQALPQHSIEFLEASNEAGFSLVDMKAALVSREPVLDVEEQKVRMGPRDGPNRKTEL